MNYLYWQKGQLLMLKPSSSSFTSSASVGDCQMQHHHQICLVGHQHSGQLYPQDAYRHSFILSSSDQICIQFQDVGKYIFLHYCKQENTCISQLDEQKDNLLYLNNQGNSCTLFAFSQALLRYFLEHCAFKIDQLHYLFPFGDLFFFLHLPLFFAFLIIEDPIDLFTDHLPLNQY